MAVFAVLVALWSAIVGAGLTNVSTAARVFCLPSSLLPVFTATVPSNVASATFLLAELRTTACVGGDVVLGLLGLVMGLLPCATFVWIWSYSRGARWSCVPRREVDSNANVGHGVSNVRKFVNSLHGAIRRRYTWRQSNDDKKPLQAAWAVLLEYRDLRYGVADAGVLAVVSCLSIVSGLTTSTTQCRAWSLVVLLLLFAQLVLLMATRPLTSLLANVYSALTLVLTALSALTQLVFVWVYATDTAGVWLVDASAGLSLAVVGISAVKMLLDVVHLFAAARRRLGTAGLFQSRDIVANGDPRINASDEDFTNGKTLLSSDHRGSENTDEELRVILPLVALDGNSAFDHFWDATGTAVGTSRVEGESDILRDSYLKEFKNF
ncbi:membrane-associated protein, putative [Bodo saltans]|uniref:Membrane-associated protein, putative n=1 Tax=Bodo saltans TaxID=75058 RepID=A0A0S4IRC8_BODSA|nr:membrane-associated protein, putative [Bodo saltans]|eukprot:CUF43930.1 membrane-associated protein, putative [Bodo saltans]